MSVAYCIINFVWILGSNDYDIGPFIVEFNIGTTNASFSVAIQDNNQLELNKTFYLSINPSTLPSNIYVSDPGQVAVVILDDDCK